MEPMQFRGQLATWPTATTISLVVLSISLACLTAGCGRPVARSFNRTGAKPAPNSATTLTPIRTSPFKNTAANVGYIGGQACIQCHADEHTSYLQTPHSRALGPVSDDEPPSASYEHSPSARVYRVATQGGAMQHSEKLLNAAEGDGALSTVHPVKWAIGSGNHSRSYLCELDGFLVESPITWYASRQSWAMSPGYDSATHSSFHRAVDSGCLYCHAGRIDDSNGRFQPQVLQQSIGCESCHGPGSLHASHHEANDHVEGEVDLTIVNPARLHRLEAEAICSACHLRADASVLLQGRHLTDFRPGMRIEDVRIDFARQTKDGSMTVVGHVEQMRQSRCYVESESLTCTSCHDPHFRPAPEERIQYFRSKCLKCHESETDCGMPTDQRLKQSATDNCAQCHMPKTDTDIPHFAFTHHRVGLHESPEAPEANADEPPSHSSHSTVEVHPVHDLSHLQPLERKRARGLAHLELIGKPASPTERQRHIELAMRLLQEVVEAGVKDPVVDSAIARLHFLNGDLLEAISEASKALAEAPNDSDAVYVIADSLMQRREWSQAVSMFQRLTKLRRVADDWLNLGECQLQEGDTEAGLGSMRHGVAISPFRAEFRTRLAEALAANGRAEEAEMERRRAAQIERSRDGP